ncbi:kinase-like domain-containing protein [Whalleya microplaca]|nr:kinase-like domain-containing protein [Whalleya microplaca]
MDAPGTVFYLVPFEGNIRAVSIVENPANRERRCVMQHITSNPILRLGLDQRLKNPPYLARFGRRDHNDVVLDQHFSRNDQCYFDFNKETGELLLHDISEKRTAQLYDIDYTINKDGDIEEAPGRPQIWKTPRQCVVVLAYDHYNDRDRKWIFKLGQAVFHLIPSRAQGRDEARFTEEKIAFAGQADLDRTYEGTMQQLDALGLQSELRTATHRPQSTANPHNLRLLTPLQPTEDKVIRYTKLRRLGVGSQGEVHKVIDMYNGNHFACKILVVKEAPHLGIVSEAAFRKRIEKEVNLVKQLQHHESIVGYDHHQGFNIGQNIEIFMPLYNGSLHNLIQKYRPNLPYLPKPSELPNQVQHGPDRPEVLLRAVRDMTDGMLSQILDALDYVHTHDPQIIHRDIKPGNILYQIHGDKFLLTDFGIAKVVDDSRTMLGTRWFRAPEVDIYSLGVTVVESSPRYASMLAYDAHQRPSAREVLDDFFAQPTRRPLLRSSRTNIDWSALETSSHTSQQDTTIITAPLTAMDWTQTAATTIFQSNPQPAQYVQETQLLQPNPPAVPPPGLPLNGPAQAAVKGTRPIKAAKSVEERRRRQRYMRNAPGQNRPSQYAGVSKRTANNIR